MVVQHNLTAMNSNRMLGVTTGAQAKSSEKLSSGYKINRAADDAAGLSISEKMRRQMRGLTQASANAEDGISAVQTAEGALNEVHDMLQRMNELATKAANGTMSSSDRQDVQNEIKQLTTEIDRVAETTKFNETYLLKGDPKAEAKTEYLTFKDAGFGKYVKAEDLDKSNADYGKKVTLSWTEPQIDDEIDIDGTHYTVTSTTDLENNKIDVDKAKELIYKEINKANEIGATGGAGALGNWGETSFELSKVDTVKDLSLSLHVGADADFENKISFNIEKMDSNGLGIKGISVTGNTPAAATYAIDSIEAAIKSVSQQRSGLGAIQNRLEHTIKNLDNVVENTTAAESQIRDTDMAREMVKYSNNNILMQAGQSMLAQANQTNQGVLSLLG
ncbi:MAG: flagellin [Lachnospiraceae bacterium]|nr:flagellin [Lachnospiraceae bacterium]